MKLPDLALLGLLILAPPTAQAMETSSPPASAATAEGSGVVKAVDAKAGKVTLHHGPITALGWPAMTMTFKAAPSLLTAIKPGQSVKFTLKPTDGSGEVVAIAPQ